MLQTAHRPDLGMGPLSALIRRESSHLGSISALPADLSHLWQNCQFLLLSLLFLCSGRTLTFLLGKQPCLQLGMAMYPSSCPRPSTEAQPLGNSCKKKELDLHSFIPPTGWNAGVMAGTSITMSATEKLRFLVLGLAAP